MMGHFGPITTREALRILIDGMLDDTSIDESDLEAVAKHVEYQNLRLERVKLECTRLLKSVQEKGSSSDYSVVLAVVECIRDEIGETDAEKQDKCSNEAPCGTRGCRKCRHRALAGEKGEKGGAPECKPERMGLRHARARDISSVEWHVCHDRKILCDYKHGYGVYNTVFDPNDPPSGDDWCKVCVDRAMAISGEKGGV